jgi:LysR family transcriptional regulator, glycine cleavage system transcriptional activator
VAFPSREALEAAIGGQGVALSLKPLADADIAAGRLIIPFDIELPVRYAYYLVHEQSLADKHVDAFRAWMIEEARAA